MSVVTRDHAKSGTTTVQASGSKWEGDEPVTVASGEYSTVSAAKAAARSWLARGATDFNLYRGTYVEDPIDDDVHGLILDATWVEDDGWHCYGWRNEAGGLTWELS